MGLRVYFGFSGFSVCGFHNGIPIHVQAVVEPAEKFYVKDEKLGLAKSEIEKFGSR